MPICGFNEKMLSGLTAFTEGLAEHGLVYRGQQNGETIPQGINRELSDMSRLIPELHRIDDSPKRIMTQGVVKYAQGFYMHLKKLGIENHKETIGNVINYFKSMDEKYYSELEGQEEDMKNLTKFLNEINI